MNRLEGVLDAAGEVQAFCGDRGWRFCFIGSVAVQRWGEPRFMQDVDLTLLTGFERDEPYVDGLLSSFPARHDGARDFVLAQRVRVTDARWQKPPVDDAFHPVPPEPVASVLAARFEGAVQEPANGVAEDTYGPAVHGHTVVADVSGEDGAQIGVLFRDGQMHTSLDLGFDLAQLRPQPLVHRLPQMVNQTRRVLPTLCVKPMKLSIGGLDPLLPEKQPNGIHYTAPV